MEKPFNSPDESPRGPEDEQLEPGEIDLTGAIPQEETLRSFIQGVIAEVEANGGEIPEWGAQAVARALANLRVEPTTGELHHFAITGRFNKEAMLSELAELRRHDPEITTWIILMRFYIQRSSDDPAAELAINENLSKAASETPIESTSLEELSAYLQLGFMESDANGEAISREDARTLAGLLAFTLPKDSEMHRFAKTGDINADGLLNECRQLQSRTWKNRDINEWIERLAHFLSTHLEQGSSEGS
ncbi:hypothetical protein [Actinomadura formosensis]|uniref:hypothetical protein n=1 Tax=Actinomadura formosensis TaxID=60706 RepID=UPI000B32333B|nr:hypothetical protein [Actinomadura formosensis]